MGDAFASFEDLVIPTETLQYGGMSFQLKGLTYPQIVHIVTNHRDVLEDLYLRAAAGALPADPREVAIEVASKSGTLIAMVVAHGLGAPNMVEKAAALPFPVQIDAIEKIIRLTVSNEGGLEKTVEVVVRALGEMAKLTAPKA